MGRGRKTSGGRTRTKAHDTSRRQRALNDQKAAAVKTRARRRTASTSARRTACESLERSRLTSVFLHLALETSMTRRCLSYASPSAKSVPPETGSMLAAGSAPLEWGMPATSSASPPLPALPGLTRSNGSHGRNATTPAPCRVSGR